MILVPVPIKTLLPIIAALPSLADLCPINTPEYKVRFSPIRVAGLMMITPPVPDGQALATGVRRYLKAGLITKLTKPAQPVYSHHLMPPQTFGVNTPFHMRQSDYISPYLPLVGYWVTQQTVLQSCKETTDLRFVICRVRFQVLPQFFLRSYHTKTLRIDTTVCSVIYPSCRLCR